MKRLLILTLIIAASVQVFAQKEIEKLNRGLIALNRSNAIYLSWRLFALEDYEIGFNLYRSTNGSDFTKINDSEITATTDYLDLTADVSVDNYYYVVPVENGTEQSTSEICHFQANTPWRQFFTFDLEPVPGKAFTDYNVNHIYPGDFDGDGDFDYIVKRFPVDASWNTILLDCYDNEGNFKWRIDLGPNVETYISTMTSPVLVADFDSDGKAEIIAKTGESTIFADGYKIPDTDGDGIVDYNGHQGFGDGERANVMAGPEFLSYIDGETGKELDRNNFLSRRDPSRDWGDTYGARMNFMMSAVGYFDGVHPACVFSRGDGGSMDIDTWQVVDGKLKQLWYYTARGKSYPVGGWTDFHQIQCIDVDGDGKDEISWGACMMDDDGSVLYTTKYVHGDRFQITDIDPRRPGLEVFIVQQYHPNKIGSALYDAATGQTIKDWYIDKVGDIGRGDAADIDPTSPGLELFDTGQPGLHASDGTEVFPSNRPYPWVSIYWDGDLLRENLIGVGSGGYNPAISKWNYQNNTEDRLFSIYSDWGSYSVTQPYGGRVPLVGDIIGDWREEVFLETSDRTQIRIYSSYTPSEARLYTLMQNPSYRTAITAKGYLCSKYPDYFLGAGMTTPTPPAITFPAGAFEAYNPSEGYYNIIANANNLSISSTGDVSQQTSVELEISQIWKLEKSGDYYKLYSPDQDAYLSYETPADGADLSFGGSNTDFYFEKNMTGDVMIIPAANNAFVLDVPSCSSTIGLAMNFWTRLDNECQSFSILPAETLFDCARVWEGTAINDDCGNCVAGTTGLTACSSAMQGEDFCEAIGGKESKHENFTGEGYLNFENELSASGSWNVYADTAGTYTIGIKYANGGTAARGMTVQVNETEQASFIADPTKDWNTWNVEDIRLRLEEGVNAISLVASTGEGGPNLDLFVFNTESLHAETCEVDCNGLVGGSAYLDYCGVCVGGNTGLTECEQTMAEAEDVSCTIEGLVANNIEGAGFSGTGFINGTNAIGAKVTFNVYAETASTVIFGVQYAHGGAADRACQILVNGTEAVASFSMPTTDWTDYQSAETSLSLHAGINEISLVALIADGLANLDYYYIYGDAEFIDCSSTEQTVVLADGWNLFSANVHPADSSIATLFQGIDIVEVKSQDEFWNVSYPDFLNKLQNLTTGEGYLVKTNGGGTINIIGTAVEMQDFTSLRGGWNLIGVPYQTETPFSDIFDASNCQIIKDFEGFWQPDGGTYSIENMEPGKAYFIMK